MGEMRTLNRSGDVSMSWAADNADEVERARQVFLSLTQGSRYLAFAVGTDGAKGSQIREFDPDAESIILIPPMAGG